MESSNCYKTACYLFIWRLKGTCLAWNIPINKTYTCLTCCDLWAAIKYSLVFFLLIFDIFTTPKYIVADIVFLCTQSVYGSYFSPRWQDLEFSFLSFVFFSERCRKINENCPTFFFYHFYNHVAELLTLVTSQSENWEHVGWWEFLSLRFPRVRVHMDI